jgi:hypothetical protein
MFRNRDLALIEYQRQIGRILNCIANTWVYSAPSGADTYMLLSAPADQFPRPPRAGAMLRLRRGQEILFLQAYQRFQVIDADSFRISTLRYFYIIWSSRPDERIIDWHYHRRQNGSFEAHLHIRDDARRTGHMLVGKHIPTGRLPLEDVVRFAVQELKIQPRDPNWQTILEQTEAVFRANRTW